MHIAATHNVDWAQFVYLDTIVASTIDTYNVYHSWYNYPNDSHIRCQQTECMDYSQRHFEARGTLAAADVFALASDSMDYIDIVGCIRLVGVAYVTEYALRGPIVNFVVVMKLSQTENKQKNTQICVGYSTKNVGHLNYVQFKNILLT